MLTRTTSPDASATPTPLGVVGVFLPRTCICEDCGGDGQEPHTWSDGYRDTTRCSVCAGTGEVDQGCITCDVVTALNADGECRRCAMESELMVEPVLRDPFGMVR